ncbi:MULTISPECIES: hypothetical protein [Microbacterium]|uniref:hypothetical protein n=1 Tax=Microbacterium TaxID=33882 RepID=UPI0011AAB106|nr:hypothetical protein [Microbacterium sp. BH-3-3-3]
MTHIPPLRRVIRLFPDYSRDWPLWENSTPTWDVGYTTTPETYGLSEALTRDIAEWNTLWESQFDPSDGWKSDTAREAWRDAGEGIAKRLQQEVAAFADVHYEPWPLGSEHQR